MATFRLRIVFGAMFLLGILAFRKLNLLALELVHLVNLTQSSIENLKLFRAELLNHKSLPHWAALQPAVPTRSAIR